MNLLKKFMNDPFVWFLIIVGIFVTGFVVYMQVENSNFTNKVTKTATEAGWQVLTINRHTYTILLKDNSEKILCDFDVIEENISINNCRPFTVEQPEGKR